MNYKVAKDDFEEKRRSKGMRENKRWKKEREQEEKEGKKTAEKQLISNVESMIIVFYLNQSIGKFNQSEYEKNTMNRIQFNEYNMMNTMSSYKSLPPSGLSPCSVGSQCLPRREDHAYSACSRW